MAGIGVSTGIAPAFWQRPTINNWPKNGFWSASRGIFHPKVAIA